MAYRKGVFRYTTKSLRESFMIGKGRWNFTIKDYFAFCKAERGLRMTWRECYLRFFSVGIKRMDVGFNLRLRNNFYVLSVRVPFAKWLNRKKYAKEQALVNRLNKEDNLTHEYATQLDEYGCAI